MNNKLKRKRGAPRGNQNARKHGFYSHVVTESERRDLKKAADIEGVDQEVALLRVRLKSILSHNPENTNLILQVTTMLARLIRTRCYLGNVDETSLPRIVENVLLKLAVPLGVVDAESIEQQSEQQEI
ncbi:MAG: hypothetical protein J7L90_00250 [Dehalococcoidia bacterium]|nr:hypothetical protein [Dehalococcoidia bacterium]